MESFLNSFANSVYFNFYDTYFTDIGDQDPISHLIYNIPNTPENNNVKIQIFTLFITQNIPNTQEDKLKAIKKFFDDYRKQTDVILDTLETGEKFLSLLTSKNTQELVTNSKNKIIDSLNSNLLDLMREIGITSPKECETDDADVEDSDDESLRIEDVE